MLDFIQGVFLLAVLPCPQPFLPPCVPADIYLFKINIKNTRKRCEICSKLTKTPERRQ